MKLTGNFCEVYRPNAMSDSEVYGVTKNIHDGEPSAFATIVINSLKQAINAKLPWKLPILKLSIQLSCGNFTICDYDIVKLG